MSIPSNSGAVIYCRASTARQETSIEVQTEKCELLCQLRELPILNSYSDFGFSGKDMDRPGFQKLLKQINENPPAYLIVYRLDRISRNVADLSGLVDLLAQKKVQLISVSENLDTSTVSGRMMMSMILVLSQYEREIIVARVRESLDYRRRNGVRYTRITPYGKKLVGNRYEDSPEEREVIRSIHSLHVSGVSLRSIAAILDAQRVPTRNGKPWCLSTIATICRRQAAAIPT